MKVTITTLMSDFHSLTFGGLISSFTAKAGLHCVAMDGLELLTLLLHLQLLGLQMHTYPAYAVPGVEPGALRVLGSSLPTQPHPQPLFINLFNYDLCIMRF